MKLQMKAIFRLSLLCSQTPENYIALLLKLLHNYFHAFQKYHIVSIVDRNAVKVHGLQNAMKFYDLFHHDLVDVIYYQAVAEEIFPQSNHHQKLHWTQTDPPSELLQQFKIISDMPNNQNCYGGDVNRKQNFQKSKRNAVSLQGIAPKHENKL